MKKVTAILALLAYFFLAHAAHAGLRINEVMYNLEGSDSVDNRSREWVEIYNGGEEILIDAKKWRFFDGGSNRTINDQENFSIPANSYVIFAGDKDTFLSDNPSFSGVVYDTGITTLNNTGATLKIIDQDGNTVDSFSYSSGMGANGDGKTLQYVSGSWISSVGTPGVTNSISSQEEVNQDNSENSDSSQNVADENITPVASIEKISKPKLSFSVSSLAFTGIPTIFSSKVLNEKGEEINYGVLYWNFGDGSTEKIKLPNNQKFMHAYKYKGEYLVSLEYYSNEYEENPSADLETTVKVVPATVVISSVGNEADFYVEIKNTADYDVDLFGWSLVSVNKHFSFPKNTILRKGKSIIFDPNITGMNFSDRSTLELLTPSNSIAFAYENKEIKNTVVASLSFTPLQNQSQKVLKVDEEKSSDSARNIGFLNSEQDVSSDLDPNMLLGNVTSSDFPDSNKSNNYVVFLGLLLVVGLGVGTVYFLRKDKVVVKEGEDFEILEG